MSELNNFNFRNFILTGILILIVSFLYPYFVFSFFNLSIDFREWGIFSRLLYLTFNFFINFFGLIFLKSLK